MYSSQITSAVRNAIASNLRKKSELSIGTEVENIVYDSDFKRIPVNSSDGFSTHDLRDKLEQANTKAKIETLLTIEPGGQMEYASAPHTTLQALDCEWRHYMKNFLAVAKDERLIVSDFALEPFVPADDITIIDHPKYKLMYAWFSKTGSLGHEMMLNTASVQINLDYSSLQEAARLVFVADCLHPIAALLFSNAPFYRGKPVGLRNMREIIWRNTDPARSNCLIDHKIVETETLLDDFGDYVLDTPTIFTFEKDGSVGTFDGPLGDWLSSLHTAGNLERSDVMTTLHQIFTQVRFKHVLEIRGPDRPPFGYELAPAAFFQGLLRSSTALEKAMEISSGWSIAERTNLNTAAQTLDFDQSPIGGTTLQKLCEQFLLLAMDGLSDKDGESYLRPFSDRFLAKGPFSLSIQNAFQKSEKSVMQFMRDRWKEQTDFLSDLTKI